MNRKFKPAINPYGKQRVTTLRNTGLYGKRIAAAGSNNRRVRVRG